MSVSSGFILIDCARSEDLHPALQAHVRATHASCRSLFTRRPEAPLEASGPWLLQTPWDRPVLEPTHWTHRLVHKGVAAWLTSEQGFAEVFEHLHGCVDVALPAGTTGMLRFWDPRVFERLQRTLTLDQRIALIGPVSTWETCLEGAWSRLDRDALLKLASPTDATKEATDADAEP